MNNLLSFPSENKVINIPLTISSKAHDFCISLLEDEDGSKFRDIENRHSKNGYQEINSEILERWLQGSGQPVDWKILVHTLKDIEMGELSKQVEVGVLKWTQRGRSRKSYSLPSNWSPDGL